MMYILLVRFSVKPSSLIKLIVRNFVATVMNMAQLTVGRVERVS